MKLAARIVFVACSAAVLAGSDRCSSAQAGPIVAPLNQYSLGVEYSNDSSHIILGEAVNRRLAGLDVTYSRRVGETRGLVYDWDIEVRPVAFLQDPTQQVSGSFTFSNPPNTYPFSEPTIPIRAACASSSTSNTVRVGTNPNGSPATLTISETRTCGSRWTYAGGLSPVGQRLSFLPTHRVQPFLLANGGFLVSTRDVPAINSSQFNFTFTFGGGLTWFARDRSAWSVDYRVQHLSNKNLGDTNPGVDSQVFRVSYTVPRLLRRRTR